jgi:hypothetical protein
MKTGPIIAALAAALITGSTASTQEHPAQQFFSRRGYGAYRGYRHVGLYRGYRPVGYYGYRGYRGYRNSACWW